MRVKFSLFSFSILLILFFLTESNISFSQPNFNRSILQRQIQIERNIFPYDDSLLCFISYRVPLSELVFVKNNIGFESGLKFNYEIKRNNQIVLRNSISKLIQVDDYNKSNDENNFAEFIFSILLSKDNHVIHPSIQINNTDQSIRLDSLSIFPDRLIKEQFVNPIVVEKNNIECDKQIQYRLSNWGNTIPFAPNDYDLLIPFIGNNQKKVTVRIEQEKKVVFEEELLSLQTDRLNFSDCMGSPVLIYDSHSKLINYYILKNFNHNLKEGNALLKIISDGNIKIDFNMLVVWHGKPMSLVNPELAIELLKNITNQHTIDKILDNNSDKYYNEIFKFFDAKLQKKKYSFNELISEFYKRADYSIKNFSTINKQNGALSDRGKIYIIYGKPDEIKRDYSLNNSVAEIWYYYNIKKEFIFIDETGLGNFILSK